jgi:hypothetical protein
MRPTFSLLVLLGFVSLANADGGLLRNGDLSDDWLTLLPELKNHHWNYTTEVYGRRDYNPDGWRLSGQWVWRDADHPAKRRVVLASPARVVQSINWVTIHDSKKLAGWPDAGGYPTATAVRSMTPVALVRDLTLRVRLAGKDVPSGAVTVSVAWSNACPVDDPLGSKRVASATAAVPEGSYAEKTVEVVLSAAKWLEVARQDPLAAAQGPLIPMAATVEIASAANHGGTVELLGATLNESGPMTSNLLPDGVFERFDATTGYPLGWSKPQKYRYFAPGIYYIFNTWHNSSSFNRGTAGRDTLVPQRGSASLRMLVPSGDETCVVSDPVPLNQTAPRLIEVRAWVKTHQLGMLQIDAEDEAGRRLDGFNFIHKNPLSIGTDDWRQLRQVFRPTVPVKSLRLKLCARGTNGFTLDDTGHQPQQNSCGVVWWDDVQLFEPETPDAELAARGVKPTAVPAESAGPHLERLHLGEQLFGQNELTADIVNAGPDATFALRLERPGERRGERPGERPSGIVDSQPVMVGSGKRVSVRLAYDVIEPGRAYHEDPFVISLIKVNGPKREPVATSTLALATWTVPIDLELGALFLRPEQKQFVRANLGFSFATMQRLKELRLEIVRRGTGQVLQTVNVPATADAIQQRRAKLPDGLRDDLRNLLLTDLDVSGLPLQPFDDPQRNWLVRATAIDIAGKPVASVDSQPFCRLAHDGPQPAITSVKIDATGAFLINGKPWMPWGVTYGHNPVYDGPADGTKYHDLANLKQWSLYDRHGGNLADRSLWDLNCLRHVEGNGLVPPAKLEETWSTGLYASTVFLHPPTAGKPWPDEHLKYLRTAPMVASVSRGPEEAFGYFTPMDAKQLKEVETEAAYLRQATGKPVMVGHGGYWTGLEFEKVPFFDVFDPETEPWYPAPVHTDLAPLVAGKAKTIWLRPQMYESVPYERWRYHVLVELIRGARGWQVAHGPGDASIMRGLHAELRRLQPAIYSGEQPPAVTIEPDIEHMVRRANGKTLIVAATTHGLSFGNFRWADDKADTDKAETSDKSDAGRVRVTADPHVFRDESDGYHATGEPATQSLCPHGIQYLAHPKAWPAGSKLVTWAKLDPKSPPKTLSVLVKGDGRWTHAGAWGSFAVADLRADEVKAYWFLRTFYRHARGFLGWGDKVPAYAREFIPGSSAALGSLPAAGEWVKLEVPLEKLGVNGKLLDGVAFLHDGGRIWWAGTKLVAPDGRETVVFGDHEDRPNSAALEKVKVAVAGLKQGTKVGVLFEDREITAGDGFFEDDLRGVDLYQRYGGERTGYGNAPVAVRVYEVP